MGAIRLSRAAVLAIAGALMVVVAAGSLWALSRTRAPAVDPALRDAVTQAIDAYFERGPGLATTGGQLQAQRPGARPRWFCSVQVVEARQRVAGRPVAGVMTSCTEFASVDGTLLEGTGFANAPMRVTMAVVDGRLTVRQVEQVSDGAGFASGVRQLFSEAGAREVLRRQDGGAAGPSPLDQARQAFGLAPSVQPQRV